MLAQIVVRHAGAGVYPRHKVVHLVIRHLGGAQGGHKAQLGRLEVGPQTADDLAGFEAAHTLERFFLTDAEHLAQVCIGARGEGKAGLDDIQQLAVNAVHQRFSGGRGGRVGRGLRHGVPRVAQGFSLRRSLAGI